MNLRLLAVLCAWWLVLGSAQAQDVKYNEFITGLAKAIDINDEKSLDKLIKGSTDLALRHFNAVCWDYRAKGDASNRKTLDAMLASWSRVFESRTLEHYERYISGRRDADRQTIYEAEMAESKVWALFDEGKKNQDRSTFEAARDGARNLAVKYEEIGHVMNGARMWSLTSQITNAFPNATEADKKASAEAIQNFLRLREKWEFTDDEHYKYNKTWLKSLLDSLGAAEAAADKRKAEGYSAEAKGADALVMPNAPEAIVPLTFEVLKEPNVDMFVRGGQVPGLWVAAQVNKTGPEKFHVFHRRDLFLVRPATNKYGVTIDGNQADLKVNPWQPVEPSAKFKPSVFYLGPDKTEPYAMWFYTASEEEPLMGINHNLAPLAERATIYYRSAASWTATIHGEPVVFYDDNANGKLFEDDPLAYGLRDRTRGDSKDGAQVPAYDGIKIGKAGTPQPFSSFVKVGDQWFHLRSQPGNSVGARPLNPEYFKLGKLKLAWKGPPQIKPEVLIVEGKGTYASARYNIAAGKEVEVPVGTYEITFGRIATGKGPAAMQAQVFQGTMKPFEVKEGAATTVTLGAPFTFDFVKSGDDTEVAVDAMKITVHGASGELYCRINGATPCPEVVAAKGQDGKGAKPIGEFAVMSVEALEQAVKKFGDLGIEVCFFPVPKGDASGNFVLKAKLPLKGALVGLQDKKNKLFGKIDPVFK